MKHLKYFTVGVTTIALFLAAMASIAGALALAYWLTINALYAVYAFMALGTAYFVGMFVVEEGKAEDARARRKAEHMARGEEECVFKNCMWHKNGWYSESEDPDLRSNLR